MISQTKRAKLQNKILSFYNKNKRNLPWRKTKNPYPILLSEVMLQQTQVDRVIPYYERFLKQFPNFKTLAKAKKTTLLKLWQGLGYNNRILRLQLLAKEVISNHKGTLPKTEQDLINLPGIGPYTAHAILAFAYNKPAPVMDTNIRRVLIHELNLKEDINLEHLKQIALQVIPKNKSSIWHNALMDYGALEKTAKATGIESLSKQSTFEGSNRQVRGEIIRLLLKQKQINLSKLNKQLNRNNLDEIVNKMIKEGVIIIKSNTLSFS